MSIIDNTLTGRVAVVSANATQSESGVLVPVDTSSSAVTLTLASAIVADGAFVAVNDEGLNAGTNAITIATEGAETIDGAASATISTNGGSLIVYSDGTNWFSLASA